MECIIYYVNDNTVNINITHLRIQKNVKRYNLKIYKYMYMKDDNEIRTIYLAPRLQVLLSYKDKLSLKQHVKTN